jgi:hypothetical protein
MNMEINQKTPNFDELRFMSNIECWTRFMYKMIKTLSQKEEKYFKKLGNFKKPKEMLNPEFYT